MSTDASLQNRVRQRSRSNLTGIGQPVGRFHAYWRGDPLPLLPSLPGLTVQPVDDELLIAASSKLPVAECQPRMRQAHQAWLARVDREPVAWGWCATDRLTIGELGIACSLPPGNRYLWDFFTVPRWRGRGIYPRLLQSIVANTPDAERFWVGHDFDNVASARGIAKAGFGEIGVLYRRPDGEFALVPVASEDRVAAASQLFGVPVASLPFVAMG